MRRRLNASWLTRRFPRLAALVLVVAVAAVVPAAPAHADIPPWPTIVQPGLGWDADWHFWNGEGDWTYEMNLPHASLHGGGRDTDHSRYFTGVLTDTSPEPDLCAWVTFEEGGGAATYIACDGTVNFSQYDTTPGTYEFTFALRTTSNNYRAMSQMVIPSTLNYPELRGAGNGALWDYLEYDTVKYKITRPGGTVTGMAIGPWDSRGTTVNVTPGTCMKTTLYNPDPVLSKSGCAGSFSVVPDVYREFKVDNCLTPPPGTALRPNRCVPVLVP